MSNSGMSNEGNERIALRLLGNLGARVVGGWF
jgi:hypothetical protein